MVELGGLVAAAVLKVVLDHIVAAIDGRITLQNNFSKDLEKMKLALESVEALLGDAERQSITDKSTNLWLKRLKDAMYAISDMIDEFEADTEAITHPSARKFSLKKNLAVMIPCLTIGPKVTLANKMKTMREDLEDITSQHKNFNLVALVNSIELKVTDERRETFSKIDTHIVGRTKERDVILEFLSEIMTKESTILAIYGIGGLGKTTLAKMIYNSSQFKEYSLVWVYVSQAFDLKKIGNSIISQLSEKEESRYTGLQMMHNVLSKLIDGKKILIVLDDLWEENRLDLNNLKAMLGVGKGSRVVVIVTTRDESIAKEISSIQPHKLALLTNAMCWSIIKQKSAFKLRDDKKELKEIGKEIASKCGGVALAAQSLGYVMRPMTSRQWKLMIDSDIWSISDSKDPSFTHVLASLRLSYSVMPPYLKLCFAYCAIFPKGHKIVKDDLIQQWIALSFIEPTDVYSSCELGDIYVRQLLGLSFLQNSKSPTAAEVHLEEATLFTMHDLVHDLARLVMVDEIMIPEKKGNTAASCYRYALLDDCSKSLNSSKIRALRFMNCGEIELDGTAFSSVRSLRVLDLSDCSIHKLPESTGALKQLRYLNAPRIQDKMLPDSITRLSKLTYLNLHGSSAISALPESIGDIKGLLYIDLSGCSEIKKLPETLGRLTKLMHLDLSNCSCVGDVSKFFGSLKVLQYLNLSHCPNIGELPKELGCLSELQYLNLSFSSYLKCCQEADALRDLTKLKYLNLSSEDCSLRKLPEALGSFSELKYLNLSGCKKLKELPTLFGNLKYLVHLDLSNCFEANGVPKSLCCLTNLQYLNLSRTRHGALQRLRGLPEVISGLTNLRYLSLSRCMSSIFQFYSDSSSKLQIDSFLCGISTLYNLEHLELSGNDAISTIPQSLCNLRKLHTLDLSHCRNLEKIPEGIQIMESLKFLYIKGSDMCVLPQLSTSSVSLPRFMVQLQSGYGESGSNLVHLQNTYTEELEIVSLENVKSAEEAQAIELIKKQSLRSLKLQWTRDAKRFEDDKMLLDKLVPPSSLNNLEIGGYRNQCFPAWLLGIAQYLPNLVRMEMCDIPNCNSLPPMDQLPNLQLLILRGMEKLEVWNTSYSSGHEYVIQKLEIYDCPRLRMKPLPPRAKEWKISKSDSVLLSWEECPMSRTGSSSSASPTTNLKVEFCEAPMGQWRLLQHFPGLTHLSATSCADLTGSPEIIQYLSSLKTLLLKRIDPFSLERRGSEPKELPKWLGELTSLRELYIVHHVMLKELHENIRQLTRLQTLELHSCYNMSSLPHWIGELTSLKRLKIRGCKGIKSLPQGIRQLNNLEELHLRSCYGFKHICMSDEKEMEFTDTEERLLPTSFMKIAMIEGCQGISSLTDGIQQLTSNN